MRDNDGDVAEAAEFLELPIGVVQAAVACCGTYPDEIDGWIASNEEAAEAHAMWRARQATVRFGTLAGI